jgi:type II secretory pathway pseudopilin PulG
MKTRECKTNNIRGATLIEWLASILILGIALLAIAPLITHAIGITKGGGLTKEALALARELLEYVQQDPDYTTLETRYSDSPTTRKKITDYPYFVSLGLQDDPRFRISIKVTNNAVAGAYDKIKRITVRVFWWESGRELGITLVSFRRKM